MFIRRRTKKIMSEVVPLLEELYPDRTNGERASILTLFGAAHSSAIADLAESHILVLMKTLRYWARVSTFEGVLDESGNPEWSGIDDVCEGCRDFKAAMLEMHGGVKVKTDEEGRVLVPIAVEGTDSQGKHLSSGFKEWIIHGGADPASG